MTDPHRTDTAWARLLGNRWAIIGGVVALLFVLLAVLAPLFTAIPGTDPYTYDIHSLDDSGVPVGSLGGITSEHWLGVEPQTGRDLFAIVAFGARTSLLVGLGATVVAIMLGTVIGVCAGFFGGIVDAALSRFTDLMLAFPALVFMLALAALVPDRFPKQLFMILVIGVFGWPGLARITRGLTLTLRHRSFVLAAAAVGAGPWHILRTEILPNLASTITVVATMSIPGAVTTEAALSFLGIGVPPPMPSWGRIISSAVSWVQVDPWYLLSAGVPLLLVTLGLNLFGDGLRDALDPRLAGRRA
jgi:peptide/nickel transport system permease protein